MIVLYNLLILLVNIFYSFALNDQFSEELYVKNLDGGYVSTLFQFTTNLEYNIFNEELSHHFNLFPKSFGEIISKFNIAELHLTFTQGRWRYNKWGSPTFNAPTGVELWVWFLPNLNKTNVDSNWNGLVHVLSGQFCSSLNFITKAITVHPKHSFKPLGVWPHKIESEKHLRYATLSRETVCTENLSPWKKLLPCVGKAGLAVLLNPFVLFDSSYHSLAVHLRSTCKDSDCEHTSLELKQTITSVFDPVSYHLKNGWSLKKLFRKELKSACPVAASSQILVDLAKFDKSSLTPSPDDVDQQNNIAVYNLRAKDFSQSFDVAAKYTIKKEAATQPCIKAHKYTTGYGEEMGGITCKITNTHPVKPINVTYLDVMPYFIRTYLHTLLVKVNDQVIKADLTFVPGYYRKRPASVELRLTIPPRCTASVSVQFEKVFLDWMQHPPDANHGYYIGSSVISAMIPFDDDNTSRHAFNEQCSSLPGNNDAFCSSATTSNGIFQRIYTEPLLIPVPLPDFSMPYNVICLTCTVIAIIFGSIFNITTRKFQVEPVVEKTSVKEKLKKLFSLFRKKEKLS